ncbi:hypothetical protein Y032_0072g711 [Ancylostoma ceylanicum]|uniref:Uncharacterized protein n=1 Tax=Ancylostoma ceylanicum TaxID=53326 RepID=A0A016TXR3_9BILA|nr:hypothetical protein Y032_0072g711 [Ancylostoma ceylanicum]
MKGKRIVCQLSYFRFITYWAREPRIYFGCGTLQCGQEGCRNYPGEFQWCCCKSDLCNTYDAEYQLIDNSV